jgi:hypothetical protein
VGVACHAGPQFYGGPDLPPKSCPLQIRPSPIKLMACHTVYCGRRATRLNFVSGSICKIESDTKIWQKCSLNCELWVRVFSQCLELAACDNYLGFCYFDLINKTRCSIEFSWFNYHVSTTNMIQTTVTYTKEYAKCAYINQLILAN